MALEALPGQTLAGCDQCNGEPDPGCRGGFVSAEQEVERANEVSGAAANAVSATVVEIRQAAEDAVERQTTGDC